MASTKIAGEKAKLVKTLKRWDLALFGVGAIVALNSIVSLTGLGYEGLTWLVIFAVLFLLPYGMINAELGAAFPAEGGLYVWVRTAYGKLTGEIAAILYWLSRTVWVSLVLTIAAVGIIDSFFLAPNGYKLLGWVSSMIIGLIMVWLNIVIAAISLKHGKLVVNLGALAKIASVIIFGVLVAVFLIKHGLPSGRVPLSSLEPTLSGFIAVVGAIILMMLVGSELVSAAGEEMIDARHDVPGGVLRSRVITAVLYIVTLVGVLLVIPAASLSSVSGFAGAVQAVNAGAVGSGAGAKWVGYLFGVLILVALIGTGSVWTIGSCRVQAIAALDGAAPRFLGKLSRRGTPVVMAILSGLAGSFFVIYFFAVLKNKPTLFFEIMVTIAATAAVLAYLFSLPAVITLRRKFPDVKRSFRVPGGVVGVWICVILTELGVVLTGLTMLWPGLLEKLLGKPYVDKVYGYYSRSYFEKVTLGTLAVMILIGVIFWAWGGIESKGEASAPDALSEGVSETEA